jgi:uncharacterized protein YdiU (UPF0061 family)
MAQILKVHVIMGVYFRDICVLTVKIGLFWCLSITVALLVPTGPAYAQNEGDQFEHTMRSLTPNEEFFREVRLTAEPEGVLVLVNMELAAALGFDTSNLNLLSQRILEMFSLNIAEKGAVKGIATYYVFAENRRRGDGRAVILREKQIELEAGEILYLDIQVKGVGQTGINDLDGRQTLREAVHSFMVSDRSIREGIDSTGDLAVIKIPGEKDGESQAITGRVGNLFRVAHTMAQNDDFDRHHMMVRYLVNRSLGLSQKTRLTADNLVRYVESFVGVLAEDTARAMDIYFEHRMLHESNVTSSGGSIDFGTARFLSDYKADEKTTIWHKVLMKTNITRLLIGLGFKKYSQESGSLPVEIDLSIPTVFT